MDEQRNEFTDLAKQFTNLFTEAPGATDLVQHHIKLISDEPVRSKPYPVPYSIRESLRKDIADMIKMGVQFSVCVTCGRSEEKRQHKFRVH